jgi:hypothetical protein
LIIFKKYYIIIIKKGKVIKMSEKRITKRMRFVEIIELAKENGREDIVEFVNHEIALLDKKASVKKPTKVQIENLELMEVITEVLTNLNKPLTISEMQEADEKLATLSNQKISALLTKLVNANKVIKTTDKRKSYFSIAD